MSHHGVWHSSRASVGLAVSHLGGDDLLSGYKLNVSVNILKMGVVTLSLLLYGSSMNVPIRLIDVCDVVLRESHVCESGSN